MNVPTNLETSDEQLRPAERARLARFMIDLVYDDLDLVMAPCIFDLAHKLDKIIAATAAPKKKLVSKAIQDAAIFYRTEQASGNSMSVAEVAQRFSVSERSLYRHIRKLETAAEAAAEPGALS